MRPAAIFSLLFMIVVPVAGAACGDAYGEKADVAGNEPEPENENDASRDEGGRILGSAMVPVDEIDAAADGDAKGSADRSVDADARTDALSDGASCTPLKYDEGLASILRGVIVGSGYHPISEHRVAGMPSSRAIVIANCGGASYDRCDELAFSTFALDEYTSTTRRVDAQDQRGHRFEFSLTFNAGASCWTVNYARLDGANVTMLTQTYASGELNTCGATGEPPTSAASCPF